MIQRLPTLLLALLAAIVLAAGSALAETREMRSGALSVRATQSAPLKLRLDHHITPPAKLNTIGAAIGGTELGAPQRTAYPAQGQLTSILFLIDTSDPGRRRQVAVIVGHVKEMLKAAKPHHRFGLATFDQEMRIIVPPGATAEQVEAKLGEVKAIGQRTYFFEAGIEAARRLSAHAAARHALYIFSDGKVEDVRSASNAAALVAAAKAAGVRIYGVAYSRDAIEPREFQNLRVPARETGGAFVKSDRRLRLPAEFLSGPFGGIDAGGRAVVDLAPTRAAKLAGAQTVRLTFTLEDGTTAAMSVPVVLPPLPVADQARQLLDLARKRENLPYAIGAGVVLLLILALLIRWLARRRRRRREALAKAAPPPPPPTIAFLEFFDGTGSKFDMVAQSLSIGRRDDNDVTLSNDSISSYHATIHRKRDGTFIITDRDSENGISINDEEVKIAELQSGDEVDLGEVRFRFTVAEGA